jgi:protein-S-isoprenylcysteine O-methyltransferase Ste14
MMEHERTDRSEVPVLLIKTLFFTILVPGTVTVIVPYGLVSIYPARFPVQLGLFQYGGAILILVGVAMYLRCGWDFSTVGRGTPAPIAPPKELVIRGLYHHTRNPMYVGITTVLLGESILTSSLVLLVYTLFVITFFYLFVVYYEEPNLGRKFGESYQRYCATVPRWLPHLNRQTTRN